MDGFGSALCSSSSGGDVARDDGEDNIEIPGSRPARPGMTGRDSMAVCKAIANQTIFSQASDNLRI